jgi:hypothetical protein
MSDNLSLAKEEALACTTWLYDGVRISDLDKKVPVSRDVFLQYWANAGNEQKGVLQFLTRHGCTAALEVQLPPSLTITSWLLYKVRGEEEMCG